MIGIGTPRGQSKIPCPIRASRVFNLGLERSGRPDGSMPYPRRGLIEVNVTSDHGEDQTRPRLTSPPACFSGNYLAAATAALEQRDP